MLSQVFSTVSNGVIDYQRFLIQYIQVIAYFVFVLFITENI